MSEPNYGNFADRHPKLVKYGVLLIIMIVVGAGRDFWKMYSKYDSKGIERPGIYLEKDVEDTGKYVEQGEEVFVTKDDKRFVGKHVRFVTTLMKSEQYQRKHKYMCVAYDPSYADETNYVLMSDTPISQCGSPNFYEIDGIVSGHLISEVKGNLMTFRHNIPMLDIIEIREIEQSEALEQIIPVNKTVETSVSISENGVTAFLDRIEYCEGMTRFYVRTENEGDRMISVDGKVCHLGGEEIGQPTEVSSLVSSLAAANVFGNLQDIGDSKTWRFATDSIGEDEGVEIHLMLDAFEGQVVNEAFDVVHDKWEMTLVHAPENGEELGHTVR